MEHPVLAIETSASSCGVCVYKNDKDHLEMIMEKERGHAAKLASMIAESVNFSNISLQELGFIAVSNGPGSFTGLRVGLSTAKGISFGANIPLVLVPTMEAIALQVISIIPDKTGFIVCSKVNTTEFYCTRFRKMQNEYEILESTRVLSATEIKEKLIPESYFVGEKNWFDNEKYVNLSSPNPLFVARWSLRFGKQLNPESIDLIEPFYFKEFIIKRK